MKKFKFLILALVIAVFSAECSVAFANPDYALPEIDTESVIEPEPSEETGEVVEEESIEEENQATPDYAFPTEPSPDTPTSVDDSISPDDKAFMDSITLAFMDGITTVNPDNPSVSITAVMTKVPQEKQGSAQWVVDGVPRGDYYSSEFDIYSGKTTSFNLSIPFEKGMADYETSVALEVHLNGVVKKIEKTVYVDNFDDDWYLQKEAARVYEMVNPVEIEATVRYWTHTYSSSGLGSSNGSLGAGHKVIYTDHSGTYAAKIWIPDQNRSCWVPYGSISISSKNYTIYNDLSDEDKEIFVSAKGYESDTDYLIWVNLERQRVNTFVGSKGNWELVRVSTCSSGANTTPTPTGVMKYLARDSGWYHGTYYVKPVLYLNMERGIAFHSILFNPNGTVQDGTQGRPASHGCIRMPLYEVNWLASYVPIGSTVVIY